MSSMIERVNIGIVGRMNVGKSSLMNLITQQATSLVDEKAGTTADTKRALFELHGIGPVKLLDTAGIDEAGALGEKKKATVFRELKEMNLVLLVIDPGRECLAAEEELLKAARELDKQILVAYNLFADADRSFIDAIEKRLPDLKFHKKISLRANDASCRDALIGFLVQRYEPERAACGLIPFARRDAFYLLIIPMDDETPPGRLLRPQAMTEEYLARNWAYPVSFRLDLNAARGEPEMRLRERERFNALVGGLGETLKCIITDSQAMDVMGEWCPDAIDLTTFSIVMINYMSGGRLQSFVNGIRVLDHLKEGDAVLIAEACNHSRIGEDIGTVQIPRIIGQRFPGVTVEHSFGRQFQEKADLSRYRLIIHCGGCMIDRQKMTARLRDIEAVGVPYTNYGIFLAANAGKKALEKVCKPWNISFTL